MKCRNYDEPISSHHIASERRMNQLDHQLWNVICVKCLESRTWTKQTNKLKFKIQNTSNNNNRSIEIKNSLEFEGSREIRPIKFYEFLNLGTRWVWGGRDEIGFTFEIKKKIK